jgi:tetratricopeptide (TPR) repeat protein
MRAQTNRKPLKTALIISLVFAAIGCASYAHDNTRNLLEGNDAALRADYTTAVTRYEQVLKQSSSSVPARRNLGIVLVKVGQYERAKKNLIEVLPHYSDDIEVLYFLGECSRGLEDYTAAAEYYQKAQTIDPNDLRITKALAWTWHKTKQHEKSLAMVESLLAKHAGDLQLKLIAASAYNRLLKYHKTIELLAPIEKVGFKVYSRDMVSAESERALLMTSLADAYAGAQDCKKADTLYTEVLRTRPFLASALVGSAKCDMSKNQEPQAAQKLEKATRSNPDFAEPYYLLGKLFAKTDANKSVFYYRRFLLLSQGNNNLSKEIVATRTALSVSDKSRARKVNGK